MEITLLVGFQAVLLAVFVFHYSRLENRIERRIDSLAQDIGDLRTKDLPGLRKDLAEEFRAQRAEVAAQVAAIAGTITAARG